MYFTEHFFAFDPHSVEGNYESNLLELKTKPLFLHVCCRSPSDSKFYNQHSYLKWNNSWEIESFILGDFKSNCSCSFNLTFQVFKLFSSMFGLNQLISVPARITPNSSVILDLILFSDSAKMSQSGVIRTGWKHYTAKIRSLKKDLLYVFQTSTQKYLLAQCH